MTTIEQAVEVHVPLAEAYNQWTRFEDFPKFMEGVEEVRQLDDTHLHWVAEVGGRRHEWDAVVTEQKPDERVAWKNTDGKENAGVVTFHRIDDTTTRLMVQLDYLPEGIIEKLGDAIGAPERRIKGDLERFKELVESRPVPADGWRGEVPSFRGAVTPFRLRGPATGGSSPLCPGHAPRRGPGLLRPHAARAADGADPSSGQARPRPPRGGCGPHRGPALGGLVLLLGLELVLLCDQGLDAGQDRLIVHGANLATRRPAPQGPGKYSRAPPGRAVRPSSRRAPSSASRPRA